MVETPFPALSSADPDAPPLSLGLRSPTTHHAHPDVASTHPREESGVVYIAVSPESGRIPLLPSQMLLLILNSLDISITLALLFKTHPSGMAKEMSVLGFRQSSFSSLLSIGEGKRVVHCYPSSPNLVAWLLEYESPGAFAGFGHKGAAVS